MAITPPDELWWTTFNQFMIGALVLGTFVSIVFAYFAIRYWDKRIKPQDAEVLLGPGRVAPGTGKIGWTRYTLVVTGIIVTLLILATFPRTDYVEATPPQTDLVIWVTAFQFGWEFEYPNGKKVVNNLVLPTDTVVEFKVTSRDVFHAFGILEIKGAKIDAIPGILNNLWIKTPSEPTVLNVICYELCGVGHSLMTGTIEVVPPDEYQAFLESP